MFDTSDIFECSFHNPQNNFSGRRAQNSPEAEFAIQFARSYREKFSLIHSGTAKRETLFVREVPVSGNGIADLLVFSWSYNQTTQTCTPHELERLNPTIRAFEFKLKDWRSGMMQAHRYKYFSHASILVIPKNKLKCVEPQLDVLRTLRIGLWGFTPETRSITCLYTPRPKNQQILKYKQKVIELASQVACS